MWTPGAQLASAFIREPEENQLRPSLEQIRILLSMMHTNLSSPAVHVVPLV